jgi:signal transduction histidine kinase
VLGCFAIYHHQGKAPAPKDLATIERVRNILRIIIENRWSLQEIRTTNERFDIMMKATNDLIWDWDLVNDQIFRDPEGVKKVYGLNDASSITETAQWLWRVHPDDVARLETLITDVIRNKSKDTFEVEYRFKRDDESYTHVYDRGIVIYDAEGKPIRMIGAAQDISERKRLEKELLESELEHHKAINQATIDSQERERSEIGKELHDNVNQVLTTTKLYLDLAISNAELKDDMIRKSSRNIIDVINEIRQLSRSLMDPSIGDLGLVASIQDLVENINLTRQLQVKLFANKNIESVLHKNQKLTVFRIVQEALNNAMKHAHATIAVVTLIHTKTSIKLSVKDNGTGFDLSSIKKGAGLKNIQNRSYLIGGNSIIKSAPGQGCEIIITFPIQNTTHKYSV